jgi:hypothetical protein
MVSKKPICIDLTSSDDESEQSSNEYPLTQVPKKTKASPVEHSQKDKKKFKAENSDIESDDVPPTQDKYQDESDNQSQQSEVISETSEDEDQSQKDSSSEENPSEDENDDQSQCREDNLSDEEYSEESSDEENHRQEEPNSWCQLNPLEKKKVGENPAEYKLKPSSKIFYIDFGNMPPTNKAIFEKESIANTFVRNLSTMFVGTKRYATEERLLLKEMIRDIKLPEMVIQTSTVSEYLEKYPNMDLKAVNEYEGVFNAHNTIPFFFSFFQDDKRIGNHFDKNCKCSICKLTGKMAICRGVTSHFDADEGVARIFLCNEFSCTRHFRKCVECGVKVCFKTKDPLYSCARQCTGCDNFFCCLCFKGNTYKELRNEKGKRELATEKEEIISESEKQNVVTVIKPSCIPCMNENPDEDLIYCGTCEVTKKCDCGCQKSICYDHTFDCKHCKGSFLHIYHEEFHHEYCEKAKKKIDPFNRSDELSL